MPADESEDGTALTQKQTSQPVSGDTNAAPGTPDERYVFRSLLGRGGMGEVWLARDLRIDREVAVKVMRGSSREDPDAVARFLREARVQGRLEHPSVVPVHDLGSGDRPYFAMKRLAGRTLADVLAAHARGDAAELARWPRAALLARFVDVCLAVELAHSHGVIHRDLKPANVMLGDFGEAYVLDWGLARVSTDSAAGPESLSGRAASEAGHTEVGALLGTPGYMAPEQIRGDAIDHRIDVFALGCILFEIIATRPAVARDSALEATLAAREHRPSTLARVDVPPELDDACARATQTNPERRYPSVRALAEVVQRYLDGDRDLTRRRELAATHAALAVRAAATGDAGRPEALREAGRAIALDADNHDAHEVLVRLLVEPPKVMPAAARTQMEADRLRSSHAVFRGGAVAYATFLALVPLVIAAGAPMSWPIALVAAQLLAQVIVCVIGSRLRAFGKGIVFGITAMHVALLMSVGIFIGPLIVLPGLVIGSLAIYVAMPAVGYAPRLTIGLYMLPMVVPLALEWLGVVPRTYELTGGTLVLHPWAVDLGSMGMLVVILGTFATELISTATIVMSQRKNQERAEEQVHVQSWQLSQMLPRR